MAVVCSYSASLHSDRRRLRSDCKYSVYIHATIVAIMEGGELKRSLPFFSPYNRKGGYEYDNIMYSCFAGTGFICRSVSINGPGSYLASYAGISINDSGRHPHYQINKKKIKAKRRSLWSPKLFTIKKED